MADRFVIQAMGILIEVDVSGLSERDSSRARIPLSSRIVTRPASHAISVHTPTSPESSIIGHIAHKVSAVVRSEQPHLWWVAIEASLIGPEGVLLVCTTGDSIRSDGTSPKDQAGEAVVGIDAEGGLDPLLCLSPDLSWHETSASGGTAEKVPSFARLRKIVIAERVAADAESRTESLPQRDALQALIAATRGRAHPLDVGALESILDRTDGAVRVRYMDPADLERSVRSLATQLQANHTRPRARDHLRARGGTAGGMEPADSREAGTTDNDANRAHLWSTGAGAVWNSSADHTYVLNTSDPLAVPILLEQSAHHIWQEIAAQSGTTVSQIVQRVSEMYGVSREEIADSVESLVRDLRERGLVDRAEIGSR